MINVEAKFNSGNGGVMVVITKPTGQTGLSGEEYTEELAELLSPRKAIDLALLILHKATNVPPELDTAIKSLKDKERW